MQDKETKEEPGILIGLVIIGLIVAYNIAAIPLIHNEGVGNIVVGVYIYLLGSLFLVSYFFSHKSFLFRIFMWVCIYFSWPSNKKMAFFYFGLAVAIGSLTITNDIGNLDT